MRRREFVQATGLTGLFLFFRGTADAAPLLAPRPGDYPKDFNAYLRFGEDGRVGCFVGKVEIGQGAMTALAMLVAEELEVGLDRIDMLMGDTDLGPWDGGTGGSLSIWQFGPVLRGAAAEARAVLLAMAADQLKAPVTDLVLKDGAISVKGAPERRLAFGQLAQGRRIERHLQGVKPKPVTAFTVIGRSARRKDARAKVTGQAQYAGDLRLPATLHACVLRPPAHGQTLKAADTTKAERVPGARIVRDGTLVAVLHPEPDEARRALAAVRAEWAGATQAVDDTTIFKHLQEKGPNLVETSRRGDVQAAEARSASVVEGEYRMAYVAHAPMEPHTSVALWKGGRMTVWASTQAPFRVRAQVAQALGLKEAEVRVITPFVGGGFGGKLVGPGAVEAARLARQVPERPVQVAWDRTEDFFLDTFRPAAVMKVRSGLDRDGNVTFWDYKVYGITPGEAEFAYDFRTSRFASNGATPGLHPLTTGAWRAPGSNTNAFGRECHLDRTAAKAGIDPLEFRRRLANDQRVLRMLDLVAERFGYQGAPGPSGRGIGLACGAWRGGLVATLAQVSVDRTTGRIRVERIVQALDVGLVVNPDGALQQAEGAITQGLGYSLTEAVRFKDGKVLDHNFDTYHLPRFSWLPRIEVVLVDNPGLAPQGIGEPAIVALAPALANAVFDATGVRMDELPMTPERVLAALKAKPAP